MTKHTGKNAKLMIVDGHVPMDSHDAEVVLQSGVKASRIKGERCFVISGGVPNVAYRAEGPSGTFYGVTDGKGSATLRPSEDLPSR